MEWKVLGRGREERGEGEFSVPAVPARGFLQDLSVSPSHGHDEGTGISGKCSENSPC